MMYRDMRAVAADEAGRAEAMSLQTKGLNLRVEQSRVAVEKCIRQMAGSARLAQMTSVTVFRGLSARAACLAEWRRNAWLYMYSTMQELEEAVCLESSRRREKECEADELRDQVVELCARMYEREGIDEEIAMRVAGSKANIQAREAKSKAQARVLGAWCRGWHRQQSILAPCLSRWRAETREAACAEKAWESQGRARIARGLPALFLSIPVWSEALQVVGLSRHDIPLPSSGRVYPRPREAVEVIGELCECFQDLDAQVRRSTLHIMSLVNKLVPAFMEARLPKREGRQWRGGYLLPLEEACTSVWKHCELVLQCRSWAKEDLMHACEEGTPTPLTTPPRRSPQQPPPKTPETVRRARRRGSLAW